MCITKKELEEKVQTLRGLKAMKEELEDSIKDVEHLERQVRNYEC